MRWRATQIGILLAILLASGCSSGPRLVSVKGIALRGGQPLPQLSLTFYPDEGRPSYAITDEQGRFELACDRDTQGAVVGTHKVVAQFIARDAKQDFELREGRLKLHPHQDAVHEKYGRLETTQLTVEIDRAQSELKLEFD